MEHIRYRKGMNDLRHLRHNLAAADEAGALRRADWVRLLSTATDILPITPARTEVFKVMCRQPPGGLYDLLSTSRKTQRDRCLAE
jgi:hypothetical protein